MVLSVSSGPLIGVVLLWARRSTHCVSWGRIKGTTSVFHGAGLKVVLVPPTWPRTPHPTLILSIFTLQLAFRQLALHSLINRVTSHSQLSITCYCGHADVIRMLSGVVITGVHTLSLILWRSAEIAIWFSRCCYIPLITKRLKVGSSWYSKGTSVFE